MQGFFFTFKYQFILMVQMASIYFHKCWFWMYVSFVSRYESLLNVWIVLTQVTVGDFKNTQN